MEKDEDLKRIRERKLRRLKRQSIGREAEGNDQEPLKPSLNEPFEVTDATFLETIAKHPNVVVDCWAPWCGPSNNYPICMTRRLLPNGMYGETIKRKTVEKELEEDIIQAVKVRGKTYRKIGEKEIF